MNRLPVKKSVLLASALSSFRDVLTDFAYNKVKSEFNIASQTQAETTTQSCSCSFFVTTKLFCRHIFSMRRELLLPEFDANLIPNRWKLKFWQSNVDANNLDHQSLAKITTSEIPVKKIAMTSHQKFKKAGEITLKIQQLLSFSGIFLFLQ